MSDTPRTDAAVVSAEYIRREMDYYKHKFILADHARDLERENARLNEERIEAQKLGMQAMDEAAALRAEVEALKVDAERYRWLRNGNSTHCKAGIWVPSLVDSGEDHWPNKEDADAFIDAARKEAR